MTGLEDNRQIYLDIAKGNQSLVIFRFEIAHFYSPGFASVNKNSWGGDPESFGANRLPFTRGPAIICFIIPLCHSKEKMIILI